MDNVGKIHSMNKMGCCLLFWSGLESIYYASFLSGHLYDLYSKDWKSRITLYRWWIAINNAFFCRCKVKTVVCWTIYFLIPVFPWYLICRRWNVERREGKFHDIGFRIHNIAADEIQIDISPHIVNEFLPNRGWL